MNSGICEMLMQHGGSAFDTRDSQADPALHVFVGRVPRRYGSIGADPAFYRMYRDRSSFFAMSASIRST